MKNTITLPKMTLFLASLLAAAPVMAGGTFDWTGAYVGANLGAIWTGSTLNSSQVNLLPWSGSYKSQMNSTAVNPGGQFGYAYAFSNNLVLGGEGDFSYPSTTNTYTVFNPTGSAYDQYKTKYNVQGSLRVRLGYALDRWLPYITTGLSFGSMGLSYQSEAGNYASTNTTQVGWVLGGGLEYAVIDNLSTRLEYLYTDYGSALGLSIPQVEKVSFPIGSAAATMNTSVLRAAVNFRF